MSYPVGLRPEARDELAAAIDWYEEKGPGLGESLLAAVHAGLARIGEWPAAAPLVGGLPDDVPVRSARVGRFPYRIVYVVDDEAIRVLAISHIRRESRYWQGRVVSGPADQPAADL